MKVGKTDFVFCESPPLFLGISAFLVAKAKGSRMIFNVSDLWPESAEKLGIITNSFLLKNATRLEEFLYRSSALITGQTQGIVSDIRARIPGKQVYWLPNGVDLEYFNPEKYRGSWRYENGYQSNDILVAYAGILGYAQGLEVIIRAASLLKNEGRLKFIILGSGPEKEKLMALNLQEGNTSVAFYDSIGKDRMPDFVKSIDIALAPLRNIVLFEGAIPSKIFENLAMEKPVLLGLRGEAKNLFIDEAQAGLAFEPENPLSLKNALLELLNNPEKMVQFGKNGRNYVQRKFNRNNIARDFITVLKSIP